MHRLIPPAVLLLLLGCYDPPRIEPAARATEAARPTPTPPPLNADLPALLERLASGSPSDAFWGPERDKLIELLPEVCRAASGCRDLLTAVAALELPAEDRLAIVGAFLGPARPAAASSEVLLEGLLLDPDGVVRDRAFRLAVALGTARRGDANADGRRATVWPVGSQARLLIVEVPTCPQVAQEHKGPDDRGRLDVLTVSDCPPPPPDPPDGRVAPRASRGVVAVPLPARRPIDVYVDGAAAPLLRIAAPPEPPPAPKTAG